MRLLHTADWHLGKIIHQRSLIEDQRHILNQLKELIVTHDVDVLLIAGDIYDRSIPTVEAVELLDDFLVELIDQVHVTVIMISGNHDHADRLGFASRLLVGKGLSIVTSVSLPLHVISLSDEHGEVRIHCCPFFKPADIRNLGFENIRHFDEAMGVICAHSPIDVSQRNLFLTHHFISSNSEVIQSESEMPLSVGGGDQIGYNHLMQYDYVALGHLHAPQKIALDSIRYSGSLLKYSVDEAKQKKGCLLIDLKEKGNVAIEFLPLIPIRDIRWIEGYFDDIAREPNGDVNDYVAFLLLDTYYVESALQVLRSVYPNALTLMYKHNESNPSTSSLPEINLANRSEVELFEDFYQFIKEDVMEDSVKELLIEVMKEVGEKNHETH